MNFKILHYFFVFEQTNVSFHCIMYFIDYTLILENVLSLLGAFSYKTAHIDSPKVCQPFL